MIMVHDQVGIDQPPKRTMPHAVEECSSPMTCTVSGVQPLGITNVLAVVLALDQATT